jgi:hypothetical protein
MRRRWRSAILNKGWAVALALAAADGHVTAHAQKAEDSTGRQPVTICELLKNVQAYRGKVVAVRGIYWYGLRQSCAEPLVTGGHAWPSALNLVDTAAARSEAETPAFKTDRSSWDRLDELVVREAKAGQREEIWATVVGFVRAPVTYIRDGKVVGGYGHLGAFPAELVVEHISDVSIMPAPTYDYRELLRRRGGADPKVR